MGGRTEIFCSFWRKNSGDQKFHFIDICSLYPYVNSNGNYLDGRPEESLIAPVSDGKKDFQFSLDKPRLNPKIDRDHSIYSLPQAAVEYKNLNEALFGLLKCLVLPPRQKLVPVLKFKFASKLFFPLCKSCVDVKHIKIFDKLYLGAEIQYAHYQERVFWGTFVTTDLQLRLLKGYRTEDVSEVWSWEKEKRSKDMFKVCSNTFLKLKTEFSGWLPCDCKVDN